MQRHYYLSDSLDELETVSAELQAGGIPGEQIYVLTEREDEVDRRNFNHVWAILRQDTIHSAIIGAMIGACLALLVVLGTWASGLAEVYTWVPFAFLAIILFGFCTWEGGLWGIQEPHHEFRHFQSELERGRHLLLVETDQAQAAIRERVCEAHQSLTRVGEGSAVPRFVRLAHILFNRYRQWGP